MELAKTYTPGEIETKWYKTWEDNGYFKPSFDEKAKKEGRNYCIQLPPPNVTGTLHMGHGFQHTLMDALIRYHRMRGFNTLWQAGTDHAGIATQIVVERQLDAEGISRHDLGRENFVERIWDWKKYSGGTIIRQMRRLGASCDWSRERFTMDAGLSTAVTEVFVSLYERGFIYRGNRLVNWDIQLQTAVSDLEVISVEENGSLWHIRYPVKDSDETIVIATTRPETMLGDVAVAVNPEDERYKHLIGRKLILPLVGRELPIIADNYVDKEFGTGCVKITPAHDFNDYELGKIHKLEMINILSLDGHINENAPEKYRGMERFAARKAVIADLEAGGYLVEVKPHKLMVPRGDRTNVIIEPMLTNQWFVNMDKFARDGLRIVNNGDVKFVPENWKTTYDNWLNNIQDWCVSRQLWWGHRIPAYYDENGKFYVARSKEEAAKQAGHDKLSQDHDVLDTWFSAALWSFSTLGWPEKTPELEAFLPSNVLVTGFDIIFFWVARMIMFTNEFTGKVPFKEVFVTGLIQDAHGNKMSKSKGNVIDPLDLVDGISLEDLIAKRTQNLMNPKQAQSIAKQTANDYPNGFMAFGADAVRFTFAALATHGREVRFDVKRIEGSRNFCNKLFNATRFVLMNAQPHKSLIGQEYVSKYSDIDVWILSKLRNICEEIPDLYKLYRFDLIAQKLYEFVWNDYCDWYLELAKVNLQSDDVNMRISTINTLFVVLEMSLRLLHPLIPFITEELWQVISPLVNRRQEDSIMLSSFPEVSEINLPFGYDNSVGSLQDIIGSIRNLRSEMNLNPGAKVPLIVQGEANNLTEFVPYIETLAKISEVKFVKALDASSTSPIAVVNGISLMLEVSIDVAVEKERLSKEIEKNTKELEKIKLKLDNPAFVDRAPKDLVKRDTDRANELEEVISKLNQQIEKLG
ncbi:MAG: valine--tRNA ligase [Burkholderiales bacterium]|jgi:valyl-tRNA synthetase|nr:valine--tRNA ligase [Burkholderiales bacterium]